MARKPGTNSGNTKRNGRKVATPAKSSAAGRRAEPAAETSKESDERKPQTSAARTRKSSAQRQQDTTKAANPRTKRSSDASKREARDFEISSVLGSNLVRSALAAVLASAAAALLYRNSKTNEPVDSWEEFTDDDYDSPPPKRSVVKKAKRKAAEAADTIAKSPKKAVEKTGKVSVKKAQPVSEAAAAPVEATELTASKPQRKARSDADVKRVPKASAPSEPTQVIDLTVFNDTEVRSELLSSDTAPEPEAAPVSDDERAEARLDTSST